jgi:hypothetical protein
VKPKRSLRPDQAPQKRSPASSGKLHRAGSQKAVGAILQHGGSYHSPTSIAKADVGADGIPHLEGHS